MNKRTDNRLTPLVSVIIPAYNASRTITDTLKSVLCQTWSNLEVILVDDGSTDHTGQIVNSFEDERIKYIYQNNKGCSGAKNTGLGAASGDFIQYLDADDLLSPDKISEQVAVLADNPTDLAVCRTLVFTDKSVEGDEMDTEFLYNTDNSFEFLLNLYGINGKEGMIQPNAFLLPRNIVTMIGTWDMSISPSPDEDGEYFCRAMLMAEKIWFTEKGINYYRKNPSQKSLSKQHSYRHAQGALRSIELKAGHLLRKENSKRVRVLIAGQLSTFIYLYYSLYPELCEEASLKIHQSGIKSIPIAGGRNFKKLARLVGFKNALRLKSLIRKASK